MKGPGRLLLVAAQDKRAARAGEQAQINGEILPGGVAGQVFGGKAYLNQRLLEPASIRRIHKEPAGFNTLAQERGHRLLPRDLLRQGEIVGREHQAAGIAHHLQPPITAGKIAHRHQNVLRHRVLRQAAQRLDDGRSVDAGRAGIPD